MSHDRPALIEVQRTAEGDPMGFAVTVREPNGQTAHQVSMSQQTWQRLGGGNHPPERCIDAAFRFLLDREPKESILGRFDVTLIAHYFPSFERDLPGYLPRP
jgi:hypothetical protein